MFSPGDEIVCVEDGKETFDFVGCGLTPPVVGERYVVAENLGMGEQEITGRRYQAIDLVGMVHPVYAYAAYLFRKAAKRKDSLTIEAFSVIKDGQYEEPKRAPAKKREKAL